MEKDGGVPVGNVQTEQPPTLDEVDEAKVLARYGLERRADNALHWLANSKDHPRNWSTWRKTFDITVIILMGIYT